MKKHILFSFLLFILSIFYLLIPVINSPIYSSDFSLELTLSSLEFISEIILSLASLLIIHVIIAFLCYSFENGITNKPNKISFSSSWLFMLTTITSFSSLLFPLLELSIDEKIALPLAVSTSALGLLVTYRFIKKQEKKTRYAILISILIIISYPNIKLSNKTEATINNEGKINIILIGVDSLRPDYITKELTPNFTSFIESSINIENTYTPIARTYPSWSSILTGKYPANNNIRLNLSEQRPESQTQFVTHTLSKNGYTNIFSQDERRFSNIGKGEGFDKVIGPPASAAEFIISKLSILPQVGLSTQHPFVDFLLPYVKANRGAHKTYIPNDFSKEISENLNVPGPIFYVNHFTLPHYPFSFNRPVFLEEETLDSDSPYKYMYKGMLKYSDEQFHKLLLNLEAKEFFRDAIIILLSDHGESFGGADDGPTPKFTFTDFESNSSGHGTNVLSLPQFRVQLSIKLEGRAKKCKAIFKTNKKINYSLVDLMPSIFRCIEIEETNDFDGSIFSEITKDRDIFIESSINPIVLSKARIDKIQTLAKGIKFYTVNNKGKLIVKPDIYNEAIKSKQRSIIRNKFSLSTFPDMEDDLIFTNLETNQWQPASMVDDKKLVRDMFYALCTHYKKDELNNLFEKCSQPDEFLIKIYQKWNEQ